jgi:hypothetical protein
MGLANEIFGKYFSFCLLFLLLAICTTAQTIYIPLQHRVYDYLDRMEARGILQRVLSSTRPITRSEASHYLATVVEHKDELSQTDQQLLDYFCVEFREELKNVLKTKSTDFEKITRSTWIDPWLPDVIYANGRNFLSATSDPLSVYLDPVFLRKYMRAKADSLRRTEKVDESTNGIVLWGTVGDYFGFYSDVRDTKESGTRFYPYRLNMTREGLGFVQANNNYLYHDETSASVVFQWKYITLQYGKDKNRWGPGRRGQLALSDHATSYDQFKFQVAGKVWKFTSLTAILENYSFDYFYGGHQEKILAAHRLEMAPFRWCDIGMHETIIYAGRKFEPAYFNPVMFYRSAEHYLGDRDNATLGMDCKLNVLPKTRLYAELFVDDITTGKLGTGYYGNKYAYLAGLYHVDVLGLANLDFTLEYARIRPFTYTHKDDITSYRHFSTVLGHWSGPNSDDLYCELAYQLTRRVNFISFIEINRHGYNTSIHNNGGSIYAPHHSLIDPEYIDFLDGEFEKTTLISLSGSYEALRNGFIRFQYHYIIGHSNWEKRPDYRISCNRNEWTLDFSFNY